jgi:hypothetical protein
MYLHQVIKYLGEVMTTQQAFEMPCTRTRRSVERMVLIFTV